MRPRVPANVAPDIRRLGIFAAASMVLVTVGIGLWGPRTFPTPDNPPRGDARAYIQMAAGDYSNATGVLRYRAFVPWMASLLPTGPALALALITYSSLGVSYVVGLLVCHRLGIPTPASLLGLLLTYGGTWHLYNYANPFLLDGFGLLCTFLAFLFVEAEDWIGYAWAAAVGALARENLAVLSLGWLGATDRRRTYLILPMVLAFLLLPRLWMGATVGEHLGIYANAAHGTWAGRVSAQVVQVFTSWDDAWFLAAVGLLFVPDRSFKAVGAFGLVMVGGGLFSGVFGNDMARYLAFAAPVFLVALASLAQAAWNRSRVLFFGLVAYALLRFAAADPAVVVLGLGTDPWVALRKPLYVAGALLAAMAAFMLRADLAREWGTKTGLVRSKPRAVR